MAGHVPPQQIGEPQHERAKDRHDIERSVRAEDAHEERHHDRKARGIGRHDRAVGRHRPVSQRRKHPFAVGPRKSASTKGCATRSVPLSHNRAWLTYPYESEPAAAKLPYRTPTKNPSAIDQRNGQRHCSLEPLSHPSSVGFAVGLGIPPDVHSGQRQPDEERPERLSRGKADGAKHPADPAGEKGDDGPHGQGAREDIEETPKRWCLWHFGYGMVTYASILRRIL